MQRAQGSFCRVVDVLDEVARLRLVRDGALAVREQSFDLHRSTKGKIRDGNRSARGNVRREIRPINLVDDIDVFDVSNEHRDAHHVAQGMADAVHDRLDVLEALRRLLPHTAIDQASRLRIDGQLRRQVVVVGEGHRLGMQRTLGRIFSVSCQYRVVTAHKYVPPFRNAPFRGACNRAA